MVVLDGIINGLACDCVVARVLSLTNHYFRKIYSIKRGCTT